MPTKELEFGKQVEDAIRRAMRRYADPKIKDPSEYDCPLCLLFDYSHVDGDYYCTNRRYVDCPVKEYTGETMCNMAPVTTGNVTHTRTRNAVIRLGNKILAAAGKEPEDVTYIRPKKTGADLQSD
jgi:hypothetical protein